ncbi:TIGR03621 family F420-dependent LLM class oxidoreductase [Mycobacterium sp. URHB0021]
MGDPLRFIAPMPPLSFDGGRFVTEVQRLEHLGFHTISVSHHLTRGWQLGLIAAMAFIAASTTRTRVLSLVAQNGLFHPALLAKDIATIDVLSGGRVELGIGIGWDKGDYTSIGHVFGSGRHRVEKLTESLEIIRRYFNGASVDFEGKHYRVEELAALPRCAQRPNPPILVGAGGPRMLELAGRKADIVGIHAYMGEGRIGRSVVADLTADSLQDKIRRVRAAADAAGRPAPRLQFSCHYVRVTDAPDRQGPRSSWAAFVEAEKDHLKDSPAVLEGTAAECADQLLEWRDRFGITYWNLGPDVDAVSRIIERLN